jgi:hypothetical protein
MGEGASAWKCWKGFCETVRGLPHGQLAGHGWTGLRNPQTTRVPASCQSSRQHSTSYVFLHSMEWQVFAWILTKQALVQCDAQDQLFALGRLVPRVRNIMETNFLGSRASSAVTNGGGLHVASIHHRPTLLDNPIFKLEVHHPVISTISACHSGLAITELRQTIEAALSL